MAYVHWVLWMIPTRFGMFFSLLNQVVDEYQKNFGETWRFAQSDSTQQWPYLFESLNKFQDPAEADKLLKIQRELDETKIILVTAIVTTNLKKIIDVNFYPVDTAKNSNLCHWPIGIGVQGLADTFILLGMAFDSPEAQDLNKEIFETIYYHALKASSDLAAKEGPL
ncbi:ribonucleoside-diphosphate reductase large subunit-like [Ipomoea triloba]|uniref:ribonucleoside-diphosphate reductase large subunit-like n=1 Tax=Ipomoea triloba TaxID=35885 RepID=UPI00125DD950|nr:ribonucleoside-diphosphate reductase large subunit-like [Ipomoea triloba]